jgi:chromosome segregation and condensation protein ScpB
MERAIVWALLNSEMKLSYEDLAALLGKDKSTIRGQINTIKQKNEGIIMEVRESNGKKRLYIPDEVRSMIIKSVKVKIKGSKSKK